MTGNYFKSKPNILAKNKTIKSTDDKICTENKLLTEKWNKSGKDRKTSFEKNRSTTATEKKMKYERMNCKRQ